MLLLIAKSDSQLPDHPRIGTLVTPSNGAIPGKRPWAADNEAYVGFNLGAWTRMLERISPMPGCLFAAVPDVVGDHDATLDLWRRYRYTVQAWGLPPAFVAQDGCTEIPDEAAAVFIGGTTDWKLSNRARRLVEGEERWVHVGRVNGARRAKLFASWGADSIDGTSMARFTDERTPRILRATEPDHRQLALPDELV